MLLFAMLGSFGKNMFARRRFCGRRDTPADQHTMSFAPDQGRPAPPLASVDAIPWLTHRLFRNGARVPVLVEQSLRRVGTLVGQAGRRVALALPPKFLGGILARLEVKLRDLPLQLVADGRGEPAFDRPPRVVYGPKPSKARLGRGRVLQLEQV